MAHIKVTAVGISCSSDLLTKIESILPGTVNSIEISEIMMARAPGYGQYQKVISGTINGDFFQVKQHSTDAHDFDLLDFDENDDVNETEVSEVKSHILLSLLPQHFYIS